MATMKETGTVTKTASKARPPRAQATTTRASQQTKSRKPAHASINVSSEERWRMVAVAAYHKAEQRGFAPDGSLDDWLEAEKEVDVLLGGGK